MWHIYLIYSNSIAFFKMWQNPWAVNYSYTLAICPTEDLLDNELTNIQSISQADQSFIEMEENIYFYWYFRF